MAQVQISVTEQRRQEVNGEYFKDIAAVLQAMICDALLAHLSQRRWASYRAARDLPQSSCQLDRLAALADSAGRV